MRAIRKRPPGRRHSGREFEGRVGSGPGRDQRPLRRRADHGRPPRHPEERLQGDRLLQGKAITFMAKWRFDLAGSSSHIHNSLWDAGRQEAALLRPEGRARHVEADAPLRRRPARPRPRDHLVPRALHQLLQALPGRHLRADQGDLVDGQPHRRLPALRRRHRRRSASSAGSAAPTSTRISPLPP